MLKGVDYIGVAVGAMIFNEKGEVLLSKRGKKSRNEVGKYDFPGGSVEFGETFEEAVKREMKEEFDIEIEIVELLDFYDIILAEEKQHWVAPTYIAKIVGGVAKIIEPDKIEDFKFVLPQNIDSETLSYVSKKNLKSYLERKS